jgi:hypothetical protein
MDLSSIKKIAEQKGVKAPSIDKTDLIRQIQQAEGYSACFATGRTECAQATCTWRPDCIKPAKNGKNGKSKK